MNSVNPLKFKSDRQDCVHFGVCGRLCKNNCEEYKEKPIFKTYLFYVRKYSVFTNDYELYVYRHTTNDPYHTIGEMYYRSETHIKRIDFVEQTEEKLKYWENENKEILTWKNKYSLGGD